VTESSSSEQLVYGISARVGSPGPGSCCVIDTCAGTTQAKTNGGSVSLSYREVEFLDLQTHQPSGNQATDMMSGVSCPIPIPTNVYARSDIYGINFRVNRNRPPGPPAWTAPYVISADNLSVSIDSNNDPFHSDAMNTFTPSTWRLVNQTVSVDKVCAEQQLMQGHATASFVKNDGTSCTVTIYAQGTRVVGAQ
jgi:hypothetical protein